MTNDQAFDTMMMGRLSLNHPMGPAIRRLARFAFDYGVKQGLRSAQDVLDKVAADFPIPAPVSDEDIHGE